MYHAKPEVVQKWIGQLALNNEVVIPWDHADQFREALKARGVKWWDEYRPTPESDNVYFLTNFNHVEEDIFLRLNVTIVLVTEFDQRDPCPHYMPAGCCRVCAAESWEAQIPGPDDECPYCGRPMEYCICEELMQDDWEREQEEKIQSEEV